MTVTPCQNRVSLAIEDLPLITTKTTPAEFDKSWKEEVGDAVPLSAAEAGMHPMSVVASNNNISLIRHIYQRDPTVLDLGDDIGWTPLFYAVRHKRFEAVVTLLELGANPNIASIDELRLVSGKPIVRIPKGTTCLWLSAQCAHDVATAKFLLKYGAIAEPAVDVKGQEFLDMAQKELTADRASLISTIDSAVQVIAPPLLQMIVEYV